jgi:hypothetical protein
LSAKLPGTACHNNYIWIILIQNSTEDRYFIGTSDEGVNVDIVFKLPVLLVLLFILISLFQGMYYMAKDDGKNSSTRVVRALTIRVALSLLLFVILMAGYFFGLLTPHGLTP